MQKCNHKFKPGKALVNLATNGKTTDSTAWDRGEGIFTSKKVRTVAVDKCIHCGFSIKETA